MHRCLEGLAFGTLQSSEAVDLLGRYVHLPFVACGSCILNFWASRKLISVRNSAEISGLL